LAAVRAIYSLVRHLNLQTILIDYFLSTLQSNRWLYPWWFLVYRLLFPSLGSEKHSLAPSPGFGSTHILPPWASITALAR
jgi:hypothetical protein